MDKITHEVRLANWVNIVEQCQARPEGQTIKQWCKEAGIEESTYFYWQRRVRRHAAEIMKDALPALSESTSSDVAFAEIKLPYSMHETQVSNDSEISFPFQPDVLIRKGAVMIGISNNASDRLLDRIMQEVTHAG